MITRYQDWPVRLHNFIEEARGRKFKRGAHDCALMAANAINSMRDTKEDIGKEFRVDYKNREQAVKLLAEKGFDDLEEVADAKLGERYPSAKYAQRGDCVSVECPEGIALAIVDLTGRKAATTGKNGLEFYPMDEWLNAWKV